MKPKPSHRFGFQTVEEIGKGGQHKAERELGWNRDLIYRGRREVKSELVCVDAFGFRGRKLTETRLPNLLGDIESLVESQSQTDPTLLRLPLDAKATVKVGTFSRGIT